MPLQELTRLKMNHEKSIELHDKANRQHKQTIAYKNSLEKLLDVLGSDAGDHLDEIDSMFDKTNPEHSSAMTDLGNRYNDLELEIKAASYMIAKLNAMEKNMKDMVINSMCDLNDFMRAAKKNDVEDDEIQYQSDDNNSIYQRLSPQFGRNFSIG